MSDNNTKSKKSQKKIAPNKVVKKQPLLKKPPVKAKKEEEKKEPEVKQEYDTCGRPTIYDEKIVRLLEDYLKKDYTIGEACNKAGIGRQTYYDWREKYPAFAYKMDVAQDRLLTKAKDNVVGAVESGDVEVSQWLLTRRQRDRYATKVENELSTPEPLTPEEEAEIEEALNNADI